MDQFWERSIPYYPIDMPTAQQLMTGFDPASVVRDIHLLSDGKRNTNYKIHLKNTKTPFLLRIYGAKDLGDCIGKDQVLLDELEDIEVLEENYDLGIFRIFPRQSDTKIRKVVYNALQTRGISIGFLKRIWRSIVRFFKKPNYVSNIDMLDMAYQKIGVSFCDSLVERIQYYHIDESSITIRIA